MEGKVLESQTFVSREGYFNVSKKKITNGILHAFTNVTVSLFAVELFNIRVYCVTFLCKFFKNNNFLPQDDQLNIAITLNRKFGNLIFSIY